MQSYQIYFTLLAFVSPTFAMKGYDLLFNSYIGETPRAVPVGSDGKLISQVGPNEFSFCMYVFADELPREGVMTLLSFASRQSDNSDEILLKINFGSNLTHFVANSAAPHIEYAPPRNKWVHICCTWISSPGQVIFYVNGERVSNVQGLISQKIASDGYLVLGQDQDAYNGKYDSTEGFNGKLTQFNLWNRFISPAEVNRVRLCEELGEAVNWDNVSWAGFYNLRLRPSDAPCGDPLCDLKNCPAYHSVSTPLDVTTAKQFQTYTIPVVNTTDHKPIAIMHADYIKTMATVTKFTMCAWIYLNLTGLDAPIIQHYAAPIFSAYSGAANSSMPDIGVNVDMRGNFRFFFNLKNKTDEYYPPFTFGFDEWRHLCISWSKKKGHFKIFLDGEFYNSRSKMALETKWPRLVFRLAQIQYDYALGRKMINGVILKVVDFNVWRKRLKNKEVAAVYCNFSLTGNVINWKTNKLQVIVKGRSMLEAIPHH